VAVQNLAPGAFLPNIDLPRVVDRGVIHVGDSSGKTTVLLTVHSPDCAMCREYLDRVAGIAGEFDVWDARLLVLVPATVSDAARLRAPFGVVAADPHGAIAGAGSASLIVADRYAQVFYSVHAGASHDLPSGRDLEQWLKYLGTLCPE
jgi:hypothetical protein